MQTLTLTDAQQVIVTAQPEDSTGNPATNFNPATWTVANPAICNVTALSASGLTGTVVGATVGSTTITVTGSTGNFGTAYSSTFSVTVTPGVPTQFVFTFGTPTEQA